MLKTYDDFIAQVGALKTLYQPFYGELQAATSIAFTGQFYSMQMLGYGKVLPSLPSGITAYIPTRVDVVLGVSTAPLLIAKMVNLGSIDISGASGTFTDGNAMPTVTECGVSRQIASPIFAEITTGVNATPGTLTVTYKDQDNNGAETTTAQTITVSGLARSMGLITLNTTDWGATDITAAARAAGTTPTGVIKFWGVMPIALISCPLVQTLEIENLLTLNFNPVRLGAGDEIRVIGFTSPAKGMLGNIYFVGDN